MKDVVQDESVPYMTCETGPGVQVCAHRRPWISAEDALSMAVDTLGDGCNLLGFYMFHGGSNPMGKLTTMQESTDSGYPNDCPVMSYDFQAPIGEAGYCRESYYRLQTILHFLQSYGKSMAPMIPVYPDCRPKDLEDTDTLRCCMRSDGESAFLFVNNHHHGKRLPEHRNVTFRISFGEEVSEFTCPFIPGDVTFLMPVRMKMGKLLLAHAFAQPVSFAGNHYYFEEVEGVEPLFRFGDGREGDPRRFIPGRHYDSCAAEAAAGGGVREAACFPGGRGLYLESGDAAGSLQGSCTVFRGSDIYIP